MIKKVFSKKIFSKNRTPPIKKAESLRIKQIFGQSEKRSHERLSFHNKILGANCKSLLQK